LHLTLSGITGSVAFRQLASFQTQYSAAMLA